MGPHYNAYGHLGATYGYQSVVIYFPAIDASLAIASNIETDHQSQPQYVVCHAYQAMLASLSNSTELKCTYEDSSYFGRCDCGKTTYRCNPVFKTCEKDERRGYISK